MKTILAICLLTTSFALFPSADASTVCDPVTGAACAGSYAYGTCDNGYVSNYAWAYTYDANGYNSAGAGTYCGGYPGIYSYSGISAGATTCDASWNCNYVGAQWYGYEFYGSSYCDTYAYAYVAGQYEFQSVGCPAGAPPNVPALLP